MALNKMDKDEQLALFESVVNFSDDAIVTKTLDGIITSWNDAAERMFGYTGQEAIGAHISIIIPPGRLGEEMEIISKIKAGLQVKHYETERKRKDGSHFHISLSISPIKDKLGVITGAAKIARDITKQKQEERHLKLLESVITNTTEAVLITEAEMLDEPGPRILYVNDAFTTMTGYTAEEVIGKNPRMLQGPKSDAKDLARLSEALRRHEPCEITTINYKKGGEQFWINLTVNPVADEKGRFTHFIAIERDVTARKNEEIRKAITAEISLVFKLNGSLRVSLEHSLKIVADFGNFDIAEVWLVGKDGLDLECYFSRSHETDVFYNDSENIRSFAVGEGLPGVALSTRQMQYWSHIDERAAFVRKSAAKKAGLRSAYGLPLLFNGEPIGGVVLAATIDEKPENAFGGLLEQIATQLSAEIKSKQLDTSRQRAEAASVQALEERNTILESIDDAFFAVNKDWVVTYWNKRAEDVLGMPKNKILHCQLWDIYRDSVDSTSYIKYKEAMDTGLPVHFDDYYLPLQRWYEVSVYPTGNGLSVYFKDVTDRKNNELKLKELNQALMKQAKELAISNAELEQFAYVASHDLQEPLRMVTSFVTQLEKKYGDTLDEKGKKYIYFAVDGAKRMRQIILDLLEFSRVGRMDDKLETINLEELLSDILVLLRKHIKETAAKVTFDHLPTVQQYSAPVRQVFQNLIGNSLKYHRAGVNPIIHISCSEVQDYWQFCVQDNGIGIEEDYFDKIFIIFQRLHQRDEYGGTGMGLAITKKIVENMGGRVWLTSEYGQGSKFYFTLPKL